MFLIHLFMLCLLMSVCACVRACVFQIRFQQISKKKIRMGEIQISEFDVMCCDDFIEIEREYICVSFSLCVSVCFRAEKKKYLCKYTYYQFILLIDFEKCLLTNRSCMTSFLNSRRENQTCLPDAYCHCF